MKLPGGGQTKPLSSAGKQQPPQLPPGVQLGACVSCSRGKAGQRAGVGAEAKVQGVLQMI